MMAVNCKTRRGITLIEMCVAAAIASLMAALLLPAISASRESARRKQCADHLRQLGIAAHAHESARRAFPYTSIGFKAANGVMHPPASAHAALLPYVEAQTVFAQINFQDWPLNVSVAAPSSSLNQKAMQEMVSVFLCPSDRPRAGATNYRACLGPGVDVFPPNSSSCSDPGNCGGAFVNGRSLSPATFSDGLSNTVMFSEKLISSGGGYDPRADYLVVSVNLCTAHEALSGCTAAAAMMVPHDSFAGATWLLGGWRQTWYNHILPPNAALPDCNAGPLSYGGGRGLYTARSNHPGGVNAVMADGSARFVADSIDVALWRALSTREGHEALATSF